MSEVNPYEAPKIIEKAVGFRHFKTERPGIHNYASRWKRFFGSLIDSILLILTYLVLDLFVAGENSVLLGSFDDSVIFIEENWVDGWFGTVATFVIYCAAQFHLWRTRGQSIGKLLLGMRIVTLDGKQLDVSKIILMREGLIQLLIHIPGIGNLLSLIDALLIFRAEHNTLHDSIAGTRVIRVLKEGDDQET